MVVLFFVFFFKEKNLSILFSIVLYQFRFLPTVQERSFLSTSSPAFIVCRFFDNGHSDQSEVILHCSFD